MNLLEADPRYLLFAVPGNMITDVLSAEDVVEIMFMKLAELDCEGDYFSIPRDQANIYEHAFEMTRRLCERRGFACEVVDSANAVMKIHAGQDCDEYHLRVIFVSEQQKDAWSTAH
jgi:hypothetical protein